MVVHSSFGNQSGSQCKAFKRKRISSAGSFLSKLLKTRFETEATFQPAMLLDWYLFLRLIHSLVSLAKTIN